MISCLHHITDIHTHGGKFYENYYDPLESARILLEDIGVGRIGLSSTSACEDYNILRLTDELLPVFKKYPERMLYFLWIHPDFIPDSDWFQKSPIPISGLKVHPYAQKWSTDDFFKLFSLAESWRLPLLIHTGGNEDADPLRLLPLFKQFPGVVVCLAHGRPLASTLHVMDKFSQIWTDTAFQSLENLKILIKEGFNERILYGTDFPIPSYFRKEDKWRLSWDEQYRDILTTFGSETIIQWAHTNPEYFFVS